MSNSRYQGGQIQKLKTYPNQNQNKSNRPEDKFITEKLQTVWGK